MIILILLSSLVAFALSLVLFGWFWTCIAYGSCLFVFGGFVMIQSLTGRMK